MPNGSFTTLKGQGIIRHHPISVLLAVMDNTIGRDIDPQFDYGRRARIFNQHNFLDYLKYKVRGEMVFMSCGVVCFCTSRPLARP